MTRTTTIVFAALALSACGADPTPAAEAAAPPATGGAEVSAEDPMAGVPPIPSAKPIVTVSVQGPSPVDPAMAGDVPVGAVRYEAVVHTENEGDRPADLQLAHVDFEAWNAAGERIACVPLGERTFDAPPLLQPGERNALRAAAVCHFPRPGAWEVRAYVSFGAEAPGSEYELARYYAGRTPVRVTGT